MKNKQRGDSSSSNKKQKAWKIAVETKNLRLDDTFEEEFGSLSDSGQGAWSEISEEIVSNLSEVVVSLASFAGNQMHAACAGIVIQNNVSGTRFLTSASLVRPFDDDCNIIPTLMIEVHLANKQAAIGWLVHYDLSLDIAVVNTKHFPGIRAACLDHHMHFGSNSKVVAVGRCFNSGKLMATSGIVTDEPVGFYREELMVSTCKISLAGAGGPLFDFDGNFVGMNFYSTEMTPFLPRKKIFDCLVRSGTLWVERNTCEIQKPSIPHMLNLEGSSPVAQDSGENENEIEEIYDSSASDLEGSGESESEIEEVYDSSASDLDGYVEDEIDDLSLFPEFQALPVNALTELVSKELRPRGYPMPIRFEGGMHLINNFEEEFTEDTWSKLTKKVASNMSRSVVSLASFCGEVRCFVCTGIFIDFNESTSRILTSASLVKTSDENGIADNLKIQVHLPNNRLAIGTVQHYNLRYNIAVIAIVGFRCLRTADFYSQSQVQSKPSREVVAIARGFESGKLMATSGIVTDQRSKLECEELLISTCKITKAGIGGPLIDLDGNFVGMNFFGMEETHYLPRHIILKLLSHFDAKGTVAAEVFDNCPNSNSWHVPEPRWYYPSCVRRRRARSDRLLTKS